MTQPTPTEETPSSTVADGDYSHGTPVDANTQMRTPEIVNAATPALANVTPPENAGVEDVHLPDTPPAPVDGVFPPALSDEALADGPAIQSTSEVVTVDDAGQVADVTTDHEAVTEQAVAAAETTPDGTPDVPLVQASPADPAPAA